MDYLDYMHTRGSLNVYAHDVKVAGNFAYLGADDKFYVVDVSNPDGPAFVDSLDTHGDVHGVTLIGDYAYLAGSYSGFEIVDISNPSSPILVTTVDVDSIGWVTAIAVKDQYAYVAASFDEGKLHVLDISNPASPIVVKTISVPGAPSDISLSGDYAYIAGQSSLVTVDISNPLAPSVVGDIWLPNAQEVGVKESYAYVGGSGSGSASLFTVDVSNPAMPAVVDTISGEVMGVAIMERLYTVSGWELQAWDLTNPAEPNNLGRLGIPILGAESIDLLGNRAYVAGYQRFWIIDISNPQTAATKALISLEAKTSEAIAIVGNLAYVGTDSSLDVFDITDPLFPTVIGDMDSIQVHDVAALGSYAYVLYDDYFGVVDFSDPTEPAVVETLDIGHGFAISISNDRAYVLTDQDLLIIDISSPASPTVLGSTTYSDYPHEVAVAGDYAYAAGNQALHVFDVSNPALPVKVGEMDLQALSVEVAGDFAYVGARIKNTFIIYLAVLSLANPSTPVLVGSVELPPWAPPSIAVDGQFVYVTTVESGAQVVDVSTPSLPKLLGGTLPPFAGVLYPLAGPETNAIAVAGSCVFVTGSDFDRQHASLWVIPAQCSAPVPVVLSSFEAVADPAGIVVSWAMTEESDFSGIHLHRSSDAHGPFSRVTTEAFSSSGSFRDRQVASGTTYFYKLEALDRSGKSSFFGPISARSIGITAKNRLAMSRPNPFRSLATIDFELGQSGRTRITIFDASGRRVRILLDEVLESGPHATAWDGRNQWGDEVPSGIYFYRLETGENSQTRSLVLTR